MLTAILLGIATILGSWLWRRHTPYHTVHLSTTVQLYTWAVYTQCKAGIHCTVKYSDWAGYTSTESVTLLVLRQKFKIWKIRKFQKIQILFILLVDVIIILGITSCFSFRNDLVHPQSYGIFMSTIGFFKLVFIVRKRTSFTTPFQCSKQ